MIQQDHEHFRGPAGVARDASEDLPEDAQVLIAEGSRLLGCDLSELVEDHASSGADITVAANPDGSPAGMYIARRSTLVTVPRRGYMDLKEQWLSKAVAAGLKARVFKLHAPGAVVLRTRAQLLRACFQGSGDVLTRSHWLAQGFTRGVLVRGGVRSIVSDAAVVDPSALLAHSIVMPGATVGAGAVVARSVLCAGARVEPGCEIVDAVVTASGVQYDHDAPSPGRKEGAR